MEKSRGFTLIELLAVIVILSVISLIAVPQIIDSINKANLKSSEESIVGLVKSAENYVTTFMVKNGGRFPSEKVIFECDGEECKLQNEFKNKNYDLTNLDYLEFKGTVPTSGVVVISNKGKDISVPTATINDYVCNYMVTGDFNCSDSEEPITYKLLNESYKSGEAVSLGGYNWHVISDYNGYVTLLMDSRQLENVRYMAHCSGVYDSSNNCTFDGSNFVYSWDKSLIRKYLNENLYPELRSKIINEMVETNICADPSHGSDGKKTYGGDLEDELNLINGAYCNNYVSDYVRLISFSEYVNLTPKTISYATHSYSPNPLHIEKLSSDSDYDEWLYCDTSLCGNTYGAWWTLNAVHGAGGYTTDIRSAMYIGSNGSIGQAFSSGGYGVRPVITIKK